jgi:hypothetical protein
MEMMHVPIMLEFGARVERIKKSIKIPHNNMEV